MMRNATDTTLTRLASRTFAALACAALGAVLASAQESKPQPAAPEEKPKAPAAAKKQAAGKKEVAIIKTNKGTIVFEFLPDVAPKMVQNFKELARDGFYNGTTFHRVIKGFMIQGGDPLSKDSDPGNDGTGSGPRKMRAEFTTKYSHNRGIVSTARGGDPNSGSCQFFIVHKDSPHLDNKYTIFGRVIEGMDVVDAIADSPTGRNNRPNSNVVMESVTLGAR